MDDYISREAAVRYLKGYSEKELNKNSPFGMITSSVLDKAERALSEMPAADVQPVKLGRWEHGECSVCGASPLDHVSGDMYVEVDYYPNYCPNCGSKNRMDGDSE